MFYNLSIVFIRSITALQIQPSFTVQVAGGSVKLTEGWAIKELRFAPATRQKPPLVQEAAEMYVCPFNFKRAELRSTIEALGTDWTL